MESNNELLNELRDTCNDGKDVNGDEGTFQFNVLDQMHANENAHTRILMNMLKNRMVCQSFFDYMNDRYDMNLPRVDDNENFSVNCFGDYIDGRVEIGEGCTHRFVIVENKVKGAVDQDAQIDRYVQTASSNVSDAKNIYVIYLTKQGGMPIESSFSEAKKILGFKSQSDTGRFVAMNYRDHILDWLKNGIRFSSEQINKEPLLISGIAQYIHYIEGPELLDCRSVDDPNAELKDRLNRKLNLISVEDLIMLGTTARRDLYYNRASIVHGYGTLDGYGDGDGEERALILKRVFYSAFDEAIPEDRYYQALSAFSVAKVVLGRWTSASLVQVDIYFENDCDSDKYVACVGSVISHLQPDRDYEYCGQRGYRYEIDSVDKMRKVIAALQFACELKFDTQVNVGTEKLVWWSRFEVFEGCVAAQLQRKAEQSATARWKCLNVCGRSIGYSYGSQQFKSWYLQLIEGFDSGDFCRSIELFPSRSCKTLSEVHLRVEELSLEFPYCCESWNGRIVYRFPVPTKEYAEKLCQRLYDVLEKLP